MVSSTSVQNMVVERVVSLLSSSQLSSLSYSSPLSQDYVSIHSRINFPTPFFRVGNIFSRHSIGGHSRGMVTTPFLPRLKKLLSTFVQIFLFPVMGSTPIFLEFRSVPFFCPKMDLIPFQFLNLKLELVPFPFCSRSQH